MKKPKMKWKTLYKTFCKMPIRKNKILFESFGGKNYDDNPFAISEYLSDNDLEFDLIWSLNDKIIKDVDFADIATTKRMSISYLYHLATAKYIITNSNLSANFVKRPDQIVIQTWHGTPIKKQGIDMESNYFPNTSRIDYLLAMLTDVKKWDYLISSNHYSTSIFNRCFS